MLSRKVNKNGRQCVDVSIISVQFQHHFSYADNQEKVRLTYMEILAAKNVIYMEILAPKIGSAEKN